ncbi:MAG TPA: transporter, partial [Bacillota bacterium]|nr:transporter [Bacillota bacterium]
APVLVAMLGGSSMAADVACDNSAFALHLLSGVSGRDDRWGRALTYLWILVPMVLVMTLAAAAVSRDWTHVPASLAISAVLVLAGIGAGAVVGVHLPGKVAEPGASAFAASSSGNLQSMLGMGLVWLLTGMVSLPTLALVIGSLVGPVWLGWIALPVGVGTGLAALTIGVRTGGRRLDHRAPELLATVSTVG